MRICSLHKNMFSACFVENPDFIKDILKETRCSPDLEKMLSKQESVK